MSRLNEFRYRGKQAEKEALRISYPIGENRSRIEKPLFFLRRINDIFPVNQPVTI